MQQVQPEVPDEQAFNMTVQRIDEIILVQNQTINDSHLLEMSALFQKLRNDGLFRFMLQSIELALVILALIFLPNNCYHTNLRDLFILAIAVNSMQAFRQLNLIYIVVLDLREIKINGASHRLPYPEYSYQSAKILLDSIAEHNFCFKFQRYIIFMQLNCVFSLEICAFILSQISIYSNLNGTCQIGNSENNFTWAVAFIFLIIRYISVGIPLLVFIIYLFIVAPIAYCIHFRQQSKIFRQGATEDNINRLKFKIVGNEKLTEDNECVICLQEFVTGEEYLILKCHPHHIYHRICIVDWIKTRSECPKCRSPILFD